MFGAEGDVSATGRGTNFHRLRQLAEGDLDWIVMRVWRRIEAADMAQPTLWHRTSRYLHDKPVEACPPTRAYRLRKFMRRNKAAVLAGSTIVVLLVSAIVILAVSNARIRRESDAKETSLATTREAIRQMARLAETWDQRLSDIPGGEAIYKLLREDTMRYLEPIVKQAEIDEESNYEAFVMLETIADIQMDLGRYEDARRSCQRAIDIVQRRLDGDSENSVYLADLRRAKACIVHIMFNQLTTENQGGEYEAEFVAYCNELIDLLREYNRRHPDKLQPTAHILWAMGKIAVERHGDKVAAERLFRESVWRSKEFLRHSQSNTFEWHTASKNAIWLGRLLQDNPAAGPEKALPMFEQRINGLKP